MSGLLIKNVHAVDENQDMLCDILIEDGKIAEIGSGLSHTRFPVLEAEGLTAMPGLFDMHVHFRDPGQTYKEDLKTGTAAALAGGVTGVLCMPNTVPPMDSAERITAFLTRAAELPLDIYTAGCLSVGLQGKILNDYAACRAAGAIALSDDGKPIPTAEMMAAALKSAAAVGMPVASHCEDLNIIDGGIINKGVISEKLGVKGMDRLSEDSVTARDLHAAEETGAQIHICHVSTSGSVEAVRKLKKTDADISCETAPHYFMLTEELLLKQDADYRMNPPLRTKQDREDVIAGILDGTIDCIVTDHAPHSASEKADFLTAPNGVVGLETSLAATLTALYHTDLLKLKDIVRLMSAAPRRLLHLPAHTLECGMPADLILVDLMQEWTVDPARLHSKSHNTAFKGMQLKGKVLLTMKDGVIRYTNPGFAADEVLKNTEIWKPFA